jgi:hypothetical protein
MLVSANASPRNQIPPSQRLGGVALSAQIPTQILEALWKQEGA